MTMVDETGGAVMNMEMSDGSHLMPRFPAQDDIIAIVVVVIVIVVVVVVDASLPLPSS